MYQHGNMNLNMNRRSLTYLAGDKPNQGRCQDVRCVLCRSNRTLYAWNGKYICKTCKEKFEKVRNEHV